MDEAQLIRAVKGMNDIRPAASDSFLESAVWEQIVRVVGSVLGSYGYKRVWFPCVEETRLFARGIGADTDIVSKEMYTFEDRGGRSLTLRPEGTAGAVRAYIEHNLGRTHPIQRWWYFGPMFRAENPQKGRYRQFYQVGAELFGIKRAEADAEMLQMLWRMCEALELRDISVRINTVGDFESRRQYRQVLQGFLRANLDELCESCRRRIDTNALRVLDCKHRSCKRLTANAPDILESLTDEAKAHFDELVALLEGLSVPFERDPSLVRGLDYYTGTTFELKTTALGAQDAILGGGRYDDLVEQLGGSSTPAIGFAAGVERLALLATQRRVRVVAPDLYLVPMAGAEVQCMRMADELRSHAGLRVEVDLPGGRLKHQMRRADRAGARTALVLGESELSSGRAKLKNLGNSTEVEVDLKAAALSAAVRELTGTEEPR